MTKIKFLLNKLREDLQLKSVVITTEVCTVNLVCEALENLCQGSCYRTIFIANSPAVLTFCFHLLCSFTIRDAKVLHH